MANSANGPTPYAKWAKDPSSRWVDAGQTFGRHLMRAARDYAFKRMPPELSTEARSLAEEAALNAIYGMMMLLDGITTNEIDADHRVIYSLEARIVDRHLGSEPIERFELAPDGDGLCIGFHGWVKDDFGE